MENSGQYNLEINVGMNKFVRFRRYQPETVFGINGISPVITNFIVTDRITGSIYGPARFMNSSFERVVHKGTGYHDEMNWTSGLTYWSNSGTVGTVSIGEKQSQAVDTKEIITVQNYVGYVQGEGELYQGLYKTSGAYVFNLQVKAEKSGAKLFVRDAITQQMIAQKELDPSAQWREETLSFVLDASATVQLGISYSGDEEDIVYIDDAVVTVDPNSDTYKVEGDQLEIDFTDGMEGFTSTNPGGVAVKDGILQTDASAEHKILLVFEDLKDFEVSVDILNPTKGLNTGLYILAADAAAGQDKIKAYNVQLESAAGSKTFGVQVYRFNQSFMGSVASGGNHTVDGDRITLRVVVKNGVMHVFVENEEEPCVSVNLPDDLQGTVGLRSQFAASSFDNFQLTYTKRTTEQPDPPKTDEGSEQNPDDKPKPPVSGSDSETDDDTPTPSTPESPVSQEASWGSPVLGGVAIAAIAIAAIGMAMIVILKKRKKS